MQKLAEERALGTAQRYSAAVVSVLAVTTDPADIERAVAVVAGPQADRVGVHGLPGGRGGAVGASRADPAQAADGPTTVEVPGGLVHLQPVDLGDGKTATIEVFVPEGELNRGVALTRWLLVVVGLAVVVAAAAAGDYWATRVGRSSRAFAHAARALGRGGFDARVPRTPAPRELDEAAVAFNAMADRVAAMLSTERELIADHSHRLRTPLTALRLEADRLRHWGSAQRLAQAVDAMEREVDHVIQTARRPVVVEATEPQQCDATEVVRERMGFWAAVAEDQGRPYQVLGIDQPAPVPLARSELAAALDALLGNVFRYTPQGTPFEVAVSRRGGRVSVRVDDAGAGIPNPDRALRRGTSDRGSTGLGLDIVRRAAESGRGAVNLARSRLGGTSIVVLLEDLEPPPAGRPLLGFVGRLSRDPSERREKHRERRRGRRAAPPDSGRPSTTTTIFPRGQP
jgi:signal transduction histidine kinase